MKLQNRVKRLEGGEGPVVYVEPNINTEDEREAFLAKRDHPKGARVVLITGPSANL